VTQGPLIAIVPNFSEGRRQEVMDRIVEALQVPGVILVNRQSDADHNRLDATLIGPPDAVRASALAGAREAVASIDMDRHEGSHPRMGAVDVIPFLPVRGATMQDCVELARSFARELAEALDLPVYLYDQAALFPERASLAEVRRGQYEGLRDEISQRGREPDEGPPRMHPTGGAVAVGARPFLVAWNIDLDCDDLEAAKRIARRVRESGGGLPKVQANGFMVAERGRAQVSMNLLDTAVTPMWRVWDEVAQLAEEEGVRPAESELIGLAPLAAFTDVADHAGAPSSRPVEERFAAAARYLRLREADPAMALELRLAAVADPAAPRDAAAPRDTGARPGS
jgi:glutamate formiminotransferase